MLEVDPRSLYAAYIVTLFAKLKFKTGSQSEECNANAETHNGDNGKSA